MGRLKILLTALVVVGAAYGGFYFGERLRLPDRYEPVTLSDLDPNGHLCTFYPTFQPSSRSGPLSLVEREGHSPTMILSVPELTPWWIKRYTKAFELSSIQYVVEGNTINIPCQVYNNLEFLWSITNDAGDDKKLIEKRL